MRSLAFVGILAALLTPSAGADDAVTLKTYFPKADTRVKVAIEEKTELKFTPRGAKEPQVEVRTKALEYEDEIQAVKENLVEKLKRRYTKATISTNGAATKLGVEGQTVQIEKPALDDYVYTVGKGAAKLDENSRALLDGEFTKGNRDELIEVLQPLVDVKVNAPWQLDAAKLARVLSDNKDSEFNVVNPTGTGKLLKLDKPPKDKKTQTGKFEVTITAQIVGAKDAQFVKLNEKTTGSLNFHYTAEGVLDGSSPQGKAIAVMTVKGSGTVGGVGGDFEIVITQTRTTTPLSKK